MMMLSGQTDIGCATCEASLISLTLLIQATSKILTGMRQGNTRASQSFHNDPQGTLCCIP